jgi:hypothetical protein
VRFSMVWIQNPDDGAITEKMVVTDTCSTATKIRAPQ